MVKRYLDRMAAIAWAKSVGGGKRLVGGDWIFTEQQIYRLRADYDALAAENAALRETRAKELSYVVEACTAALVIRTTHESRDALRDLRAWATNRIDAHLAREEKP